MSWPIFLQSLRDAIQSGEAYSHALLILAAFFIGAIPSGYLVGQAHGVDIRRRGSGNIGATNVQREIGKGAGMLTLALDVVKGIIGVKLGRIFGFAGASELEPVLGFAAVAGHCFSPLLRFHGGKGVATGLGVFAMLAPLPTFVAVIVFAAVVGLSRYVSLGSITAAVVVPLLLAVSDSRPLVDRTVFFAVLTSALVIIRHHQNIKRLLTGQEHKIRLG